MITLEFSYQEVKHTKTYEMTCVATGGSPFVKDASDVFINIASPADMTLLPDTPGGDLYRDNTITMIFRDPHTQQLSVASIEEQVGELNSINLANKTGEILYQNIV